MNTAVLLLSCPGSLARKGVVAAISNFIIAHNGGIIHSDDHLDSGLDLFLSRLEWDLTGFNIPVEDFETHFKPVAERFLIKYRLALSEKRPKLAILVSSYDHCLADLLYRQHTGELSCDIPLVIGNHVTSEPVANFYKIPFHAIVGKSKPETEQQIVELLRPHDVDLLVLARYMQILSADFVNQFPWRILNIH